MRQPRGGGGLMAMRVFALSDIHVDFDANARWVEGLSRSDYRDDVLVLAGDVSDSLALLANCLAAFVQRFRKVFFVPGNHELWVRRDGGEMDSLGKFAQVLRVAEASGASTRPGRVDDVSFVPMLGWYDGSFGPVDAELEQSWMDFRACRWPQGWSSADITEHFIARNELAGVERGRVTISFSHFLPRIDLMPDLIPPAFRKIYPVLGSRRIETLVRTLRPDIHVYGHSHVNREVTVDGLKYINNAFAYPYEERIARKALKCIHRT
jgi:Icc-related predicted phosphoesterase